MKSYTINKEIIWLVYYIALLIVSFLLMRPEVSLSVITRLLVMVAVFVPSFFKINLFPFVFITFTGISRSSFCPIIPTEIALMASIVVIGYLFFNKKKNKENYVFYGLAVCLYFIVFSTINDDLSERFLIMIPLCILISDMIRTKEDIQLVLISFMVISLFLSLLYLFNQSAFVYSYRETEGLERSAWMNANEFSAIIAAGGVLSVAYLINVVKVKRIPLVTVMSVVTVLVSFYVVTLNGSRGAFFAFSIPAMLMLLFSNTKTYIKVLVLAAGVVFIIWMLNNDVFELMTYRMQQSSFDSGGDRTRIWSLKLNTFIEKSSPIQLLFGIGRESCNNLAEVVSTHNDFVTSLIGFGILGLVLFSFFIIVYPFKCVDVQNKRSVSILLLYLIIECCMAEPFYRGNFVVTMFYFFVIKYSMIIAQKGYHSGKQIFA